MMLQIPSNLMQSQFDEIIRDRANLMDQVKQKEIDLQNINEAYSKLRIEHSQLENEHNHLKNGFNTLNNNYTVLNNTYTVLKNHYDEQERIKKLTKFIPIIFDDDSSQYDSVIDDLSNQGKKNYITFKVCKANEISSTKLALYFINLATPRLDENYDNKKFATIAQTLGAPLEKVVMRYGTNSSAFPDHFQSEMVKYQLIYDGKKLLNCRANDVNVGELLSQIMSLYG